MSIADSLTKPSFNLPVSSIVLELATNKLYRLNSLFTTTDSLDGFAGKSLLNGSGTIPVNALSELGVTATSTELNYTDGVTAAIQDQLNDKQPEGAITGFTTRTTSSYTLVLADQGRVVEMGNATADTLRVPLNASVSFPINSVIYVENYGDGSTIVEFPSGIEVDHRSDGTGVWRANIDNKGDMVALIKRAADRWKIIGRFTSQ
ncbi:MAG: hypothetical protein F6K19_01710 [Cyanothece sp. SIO1E1]|nr:hypothetical protein [Cyanothece sp. SIO1E1]